MAPDVEVVVVGGGVAEAYDLFGPAFESTVRSRTFRAIAADVAFLRASLGAEAGAIGAACLALT